MKQFLFILAVAGSFTACKKSTPAPAGCIVTNTSITGKYTISAVTYKTSSSASATDVFTGMSDCQKDDSYDLKSDGSLVISEETNSCGLPPLPGTPNTWSLQGGNTVLVMGANLNIVSFDCGKLVVTEKNVITEGDIKTTTFQK